MTGTHLLLPFDIVEANYLLPPPESLLSTTDLVALQKRQKDLARLQDRVHKTRNWAALQFERYHFHTIRDFNFKAGDLVLIRNTAIEKALNWKMRPRYVRPMVVISRNKGGAYIICDLDGMLGHAPIAAFRVVPYLAHEKLELPDIEQHIDISVSRLRELENTTNPDPDIPEDPNDLVPDDTEIPDDQSDNSDEEAET